MDLLARREHSRVELQQKLQQRQFPQEEIEGALEELVTTGLLSDARFAENYIHYRANKGYGPNHIRAELAQRGVDELCIDEQISYYDMSFWEERCLQVWKKKFGGVFPEDYAAKAKHLKFLQYRGFSGEMAIKCLEKCYENQ